MHTHKLLENSVRFHPKKKVLNNCSILESLNYYNCLFKYATAASDLFATLSLQNLSSGLASMTYLQCMQ